MTPARWPIPSSEANPQFGGVGGSQFLQKHLFADVAAGVRSAVAAATVYGLL